MDGPPGVPAWRAWPPCRRLPAAAPPKPAAHPPHPPFRHPPRRRALSQRVAVYTKRVATEGDALADETEGLSARVSRALAAAAGRLGEGPQWMDAVAALEGAKGVLQGDGPGGDL